MDLRARFGCDWVVDMRSLIFIVACSLVSTSAFAQEDACLDGSFCDASGDAHNCDGVDTVTTCGNSCRVFEDVARCTLNSGDTCVDVVEVCPPTDACISNAQGQYLCQPSFTICNPDNLGVCDGNNLIWACANTNDLPAAFVDDCTALGGTCDESILGCSGIQNGGTCDETPGCTPGTDCFWTCEQTCQGGSCVDDASPPPPGEGEGEGEQPPGEGEGEDDDFDERDREEGAAPTNCQASGFTPALPFVFVGALWFVRGNTSGRNGRRRRA